MPTSETMPKMVWAHISAYLPEVFEPVKRARFPTTKPREGLWTSPATSTGSVWSRWCVDNGTYGAEEWLTYTPITPQSDAKIAIIDSVESYENLYHRYPDRAHSRFTEVEELLESVYHRHRPDPRGAASPSTNSLLVEALDFPKLAQDFDAIWLTEEPMRKMEMKQIGLFDWSVETVLWLRKGGFSPGRSYCRRENCESQGK